MLEMSKFCKRKPKSWSQLLTTSLRQVLFFFYTCLKLFVLQKVNSESDEDL